MSRKQGLINKLKGSYLYKKNMKKLLRTKKSAVSLGLLLGALTITSCSDNETDSSETGLDSGVAPSENFDLSHWKVTLSTGGEVFEDVLSNGFILEDQFYTGDDGGMVFKNYPGGSETNTTVSSTYSRVEFREMLRDSAADPSDKEFLQTGINDNNWVFGMSTEENQELAGAVDGTLEATLVVNHVTTNTDELLLEDYETEEEYLIQQKTQNGRIIIGQIHASDDEPCRIYYHKQPDHEKGAIYFAYEPVVGDEQFINLIGNYTNGTWLYDTVNATEPENGIALGEEFSYKIDAQGAILTVTIYDEAKNILAMETVDMTDSGHADDYMYFKAGLYSSNKYVGNETDYEQVTFYNLDVTHF